MIKKKPWTSFADLAGDPSVKAAKQREFPVGASRLPVSSREAGDLSDIKKTKEGEGVSRRNFLKHMAAPLALTGLSLSGCAAIRKPLKKLYPYANGQPEYLLPGKPIYFASASSLREEVTGLLVKNYEGGHPVKIEGNPLFPENAGKTTAFQQAEILDLYDPDRYNWPLKQGLRFDRAMDEWMDMAFQDSYAGEGTALIYSHSPSPSYYRLLKELKERYPLLRSYRYDAINNDAIYEGIKLATLERALPMPLYEHADVIVSLGGDFLGLETGNLAAAAEFSKRRNPEKNMNRLYQFENSFSLTGAAADHRFLVKASNVELLAYAFLIELYRVQTKGIPKKLITLLSKKLNKSFDVLKTEQAFLVVPELVQDMLMHAGRSLMVAGAEQPPLVHALVFYINQLLRAPVKYYASPFDSASHPELQETSHAALLRLRDDLQAKKINHAAFLDSDLFYKAPHAFNFPELFKGVNTLSLALKTEKTAKASQYVLPLLHFLEDWGDLLGHKGAFAVQQPLLQPLHDGSRSRIGFLNKLLGSSGRPAESRKTVRATLAVSERAFKGLLNSGFGMRVRSPKKVSMAIDKFIFNIEKGQIPLKEAFTGVELSVRADYSVYDGRYINNAWLQELPDPITKITWENVIMLSYADSLKYDIKSYDVLRLTLAGQTVEGPAWITPGQAAGSVSVRLGYGQTESGDIAEGSGFSVGNMLSSEHAGFFFEGLVLEKTGEKSLVASVQDHWKVDDELFTGGVSSNSQNDRPLYRHADLEEFKKHPKFAAEEVEIPKLPAYHDRVLQLEKRIAKRREHGLPEDQSEGLSIFQDPKYVGEYQWAMTIDLASCIGCNACTIACQAENNIPVVGKEMVLRGREMHWIRLDRYFEGDPENPKPLIQPVNCMQCEQAPCEQVCPVAATVHSDEGLNDMVYNRCIGTRFCSNNCPYKVRRFNFFDYHGRSEHSQKRLSSHVFDVFREPKESLKMVFNPDVTVRMRGVMEKCTYCVQRINAKRIQSRNEKRSLVDAEIQTACEQVCPTSAITFGDILNKKSRIVKLKKNPRNYSLLGELNTRPRTTYLAAVDNPNTNMPARYGNG